MSEIARWEARTTDKQKKAMLTGLLRRAGAANCRVLLIDTDSQQPCDARHLWAR